jgi:hypothetical protein
VVLAQPARLAQPGERALHHSPTRQQDVPLAPLHALAAVVPAREPANAGGLRRCESMIAALGSGSRASCRCPRDWSRSCARRRVPSSRQRRNRDNTVGHGGNSRGSMGRAQPERRT